MMRTTMAAAYGSREGIHINQALLVGVTFLSSMAFTVTLMPSSRSSELPIVLLNTKRTGLPSLLYSIESVWFAEGCEAIDVSKETE